MLIVKTEYMFFISLFISIIAIIGFFLDKDIHVMALLSVIWFIGGVICRRIDKLNVRKD